MTTPAPAARLTADRRPDRRACAASTGDGRLLFALRTLRMFAYGFLAVVLVLYLAAIGLDALAIGLVLTLTLIGDTIISLWLTTHADRIGRRRVLVAGSLLMVGGRRRVRPDELAAAAHPRRHDRRHLTRPATRSARSSPSSRRRSRRRSRTPGGRRPSPGTTSSATSRPRPGRWSPGCSARRSSTAGGRRPTPTAPSSSATR